MNESSLLFALIRGYVFFSHLWQWTFLLFCQVLIGHVYAKGLFNRKCLFPVSKFVIKANIYICKFVWCMLLNSCFLCKLWALFDLKQVILYFMTGKSVYFCGVRKMILYSKPYQDNKFNPMVENSISHTNDISTNNRYSVWISFCKS
jgi:hypothetical protein